MSLTTLLVIIKYMSRPKNDAVKDIDIANILCQKYRYRINIGNGNIDPPLIVIFEKAGFKLCVNDYTENSAKVERRYGSVPSDCLYSLWRLFIWNVSSTTWSRVDTSECRGCHFQLPPRCSWQVAFCILDD